MGIEAMFDKGAVVSAVKVFEQRLGAATVFLLNYLGEGLVKYAKEHYNYTDQTGNLTNSMGYVIVRDGTLIHHGEFTPGDGMEAGLKVANKVAKSISDKFSLIIVAGMEYAAYVEAKGYNVIYPAELKAREDFPEAMRELTKKAKEKAFEIFGATA